MSEETFKLTPKGLLFAAGWDDRVINEAVGELTRYCMQHGCGLAIVEGELRFVRLTREPVRDGDDGIDGVDAGAAKAPPVPEDGVVAMVKLPVGVTPLVRMSEALQAASAEKLFMREQPKGWLSFVKEGGGAGDGR